MNYRSVTQAIQLKLSGVEGVGKSYPLRKFALNGDEIKQLYTIDSPDTGEATLNGWTISRSGFSDEQIGTDYTNELVHRFIIRGFLAVNSSIDSELLFNEIIDRVSLAFSPGSDLGEEIESAKPVQALVIDYAPFAGSFAHYCELELSITELT